MKTDDVRIKKIDPLISPDILMEDEPANSKVRALVSQARNTAEQIIKGEDDRLLVVIGPCSIHDTKAALEYADRLAALSEKHAKDLFIIMRVYFEKPRTTVGWKGLLNDPDMDESYKINQGLRKARRLLLDIAEKGLPAATEFLDTISPQFIADLISWGAIGARTTESQVHRELASGLSMPIGFKNGTSGSKQIAIDGIIAASYPHRFLSVTKQGVAAIVSTKGNPSCQIILRGSTHGPNYDEESVRHTWEMLQKNNISNKIMVDLSHGNSSKDFKKQPLVAQDIARQLSSGNDMLCSVMIESFLVEGAQKINTKGKMTYGQSITDACIGWDDTVSVLETLAEGVRNRRKALKK